MKKMTFIRIPKNASTSIYSFFGDSNTIRNEDLSSDNDKYLNIFEPSHCTANEAAYILGDAVLDFPVLAVVRNPYDRLVSMFFFAKKYNLGDLYGISTDSFDEFAEDFSNISNDENFFHAISQCDFIDNDKSKDFTICRFENLENDISDFIDRNKLDFNMNDFPKLNGTIHDDYQSYYSDKSKIIVSRMWADDLDCFGYSF